jgi:anaerobic selenocysteine-containing dehydrogenase
MTVAVEDGKAVAIGGDPDHRFTQGFLCAKVNQYLDRVYSPDRVLHPLRRVGRKGEGRFARISWDEALDEIAARFRASIAEHGRQAILPIPTRATWACCPTAAWTAASSTRWAPASSIARSAPARAPPA